MKFEEQLNSMVRGDRNRQLVPLMLRGLGETNDDAQTVVNMIHAAHPDMTEAELRHAMQSAQAERARNVGWKPSGGRLMIEKAVKIGEQATEDERTFIERTIAKCPKATSADLMNMSPIDIRGATPREQAMAYCATVFPDDRHFVFTATEESKFHKRTFDTMKYPSRLFREIADGGTIPNYAIANQFTGEPDDWDKAVKGDDFDTFEFTGDGSFACMKTLATRRLALLEFDAMPLDEQARFWVSAIKDWPFGYEFSLRTLVFSGTKSIHALIRVESAEICGYHMDEYGENWMPEWSDDPAAKWAKERREMSMKTETADDERYRADRACKDPTRLTRFAGATRLCKDGKRRIQRLLWCAEPTDFDIPYAKNCGQSTYYTEGYGLNVEYYNNENHSKQ